MPSSVRLGSRPSTASSNRYSVALKPCSATSSGVILRFGLTMRGDESIACGGWQPGYSGTSDASPDTGKPDLPSGKRRGGRSRLSRKAFDQAPEQLRAVGAAKRGLGKALRMRHEAKHGSARIVDACDGIARVVGICFRRERPLHVAIAEGDAAFAF